MKNTYTEPMAEVILFEKKDAIVASGETTTAEGENAYENYAAFL